MYIENFTEAVFYLVVAIVTIISRVRPGIFWENLRGRGRWGKAGQKLVRGRCGRGGDGGAGARAGAQPVLAAEPIALSCER